MRITRFHNILQQITIDTTFSAVLYIVAFMAIPLLSDCPAHASNYQDPCYRKALEWIGELDIEDTAILEKHTLSRCAFSQKWLSRSQKGEKNRFDHCTGSRKPKVKICD